MTIKINGTFGRFQSRVKAFRKIVYQYAKIFVSNTYNYVIAADKLTVVRATGKANENGIVQSDHTLPTTITKFYWEVTMVSSVANSGFFVGMKNDAVPYNAGIGSTPSKSWTPDPFSWQWRARDGAIFKNGASSSTGQVVGSEGKTDVYGVALDTKLGQAWIRKNGVWLNDATSDTISKGTATPHVTGIPASCYPIFGNNNNFSTEGVQKGIVNFGSAPWTYPAPSGFKGIQTN